MKRLVDSAVLHQSIRAIVLHGCVLSFFFCLIIWRFAGVFRGIEHFLYPGDTADLTYSLYVAIARSIKDGVFPLWNPHSFNGYPLISYPQVSLLYPLNILSWLIPYQDGPYPFYAYEYLVLFHILFAGYATFLLARSLRLSAIGSVIGGIAYMFSPNILIFLGWGYQIITFPWYPLLMLFLWKSRKELRLRYAIIAGICLGILIIASPAQPAIMALFLIGFIALVDSVVEFAQTKSLLGVLFLIKNYVLIVITGVLIGSLTLLPLIEFMPHSIRFLGIDGHVAGDQKIPQEALVTHRMQTESLYGFLTPTLSHTPVANSFFGASLIILASFALLNKASRKLAVYLFILSGFSIIYALGIFFPRYFYHVPFLNMVREPDKYLFFVSLSLSICGAIGYDFILKLKSVTRLARILVLTMLIVFVGLLFVYRALHMDSQSIVHGIIVVALIAVVLIPKHTVHSLKIGRLLIAIPILVIVIADVFLYQPYLLNEQSFDISGYLQSQNKIQKIAPKFPDVYRIGAVENSNGWPYSFTGGDLVGYFDNFGYGNPLYYKMMEYRSKNNYCGGYYDLMNTKYFVSSTKYGPALDSCNNTIERVDTIENVDHIEYDKKPYNQSNDLEIYENKNRLGYAWLVPSVVLSNGKHPIYQIDNGINLREEALITDKADYRTLSTFIGDQNGKRHSQSLIFEIDKYSPNEIELSIRPTHRGLLVISEIFYPGWVAFVDGKKTRIYEVDHMMRGIPVDKSSGQVVLRYQPWSFYNAIIIALLTCTSLVIYILRGRKFVDQMWLYLALILLLGYMVYLYVHYSAVRLWITI